MSSALKAIFLDREGVITPKLGKGEFILRPEQAVLGEGVVAALRELQAFIPRLYIVSNQSCVGRGLLSSEEAFRLHERIVSLLQNEGVEIADSRLCLHTDEDDCSCRKPKPGMIETLCKAHGLHSSETAMIGDSITDVEAGRAAGCAVSILLTSTSVQVANSCEEVKTLLEAVQHIQKFCALV